MKQRLKIIFASILVLCTFSGCATSSPVNPPEEIEEVNLDWYINFSWMSTQWGASDVSKEITNHTGVSVDFMMPTGNESEKLNAMIAQDSLPDIITLGWWEPQVQTLMNTEYTYPLNELAEQYSPEFFDYAGEQKLEWYRSSNGNVYCYPNCSISPEDHDNGAARASNQSFLVRKDIYEALGSPDMSTPEGFMNAIRLAAEKYPYVNGQPLIPFGAHEFDEYGCDSLGGMLMNFLAVPFEEDGKMYDRTSDEEYLRWLKVFRQLFSEGLITSDIFVVKRAQMDERIKNGQYFCMLYQHSDIAEDQKYILDNDPERVYIAVDGPKNSNGDPHRLASVGINGWTVTFITKNCENPEKAIEFLTFLMSEEGQKLTYLGVEGKHYTWENGEAKFTDEVEELYYGNYNKFISDIGADNTYWMMENTVMQNKWPLKLDEVLLQPQEWSEQYSYYCGQYEINLDSSLPEYKTETKIKTLWGTTLPKLLMADSDQEFDRIFDEYLEERDSLGFDELNDLYTEIMLSNKEQLGLE